MSGFPSLSSGAVLLPCEHGATMRILYYDCFAGISGDMNLAALLHLGVEPEYLANGLSRLSVDRKSVV